MSADVQTRAGSLASHPNAATPERDTEARPRAPRLCQLDWRSFRTATSRGSIPFVAVAQTIANDTPK